MPGRMITRGAKAGVMVALSAAAVTPDLGAQQQIQVVVTAVPNPVAAGRFALMEDVSFIFQAIEVQDPGTKTMAMDNMMAK